MAGTLEVHLNRDEPHSVAVATPSFAADGSFDVVLENHGASLHVHLHLDDDLSAAATLGAANHYVDEGGVRRVRVSADERRLPVRGRLEVVTGYGAETEYVTVEIREPGSVESGVQVDERLARPRSQDAGTGPPIDPNDLPVIALGAVALLIAVVAVFLIGDLLVLFGVLAVVVGLGVAGVLLWR